MNKTNIGYLHSFVFAVAIVLLVGAGDPLKTQHKIEVIWLMKASAFASTIGICLLAISFVPGSRNNMLDEQIDSCERVRDSLEFVDKDDLQNFEELARKLGMLLEEQSVTDKHTRVLNSLSLALIAISSVIFFTGLILL